MTIEDKLKNLILSRYRSIREFTQVIDMPYSTFDGILKRGIDNSSVVNVIKVCQALEISADALADGQIRPTCHLRESQIDASDVAHIIDQVKSKILTYDNLTLQGKPIDPIIRNTLANSLDIVIEVGVQLSEQEKKIQEYRDKS